MTEPARAVATPPTARSAALPCGRRTAARPRTLDGALAHAEPHRGLAVVVTGDVEREDSAPARRKRHAPGAPHAGAGRPPARPRRASASGGAAHSSTLSPARDNSQTSIFF